MSNKALIILLAALSFSNSQASEKLYDQAVSEINSNWLARGEYAGKTPEGNNCLVSLRTNILNQATGEGLSTSLNFTVFIVSSPTLRATLMVADPIFSIERFIRVQSDRTFSLQVSYKNSDTAHLVLEKRSQTMGVYLNTTEGGVAKSTSCEVNQSQKAVLMESGVK